MKQFAMIAAVSALALSGCVAGFSAAAPGNYAAKSVTVPLQQSWSVIDSKRQGVQRARFTKDGFGLNQLAFFVVEEGRDLRPGKNKRVEAVNYQPGMSQLDLVEFMQASLASLGYASMSTQNVVPATFVGQDGIAMDLRGKYSSGLNLQGMARIAETDRGLVVGFYVSPARYYFERDAAEARAALDGATLR